MLTPFLVNVSYWNRENHFLKQYAMNEHEISCFADVDVDAPGDSRTVFARATTFTGEVDHGKCEKDPWNQLAEALLFWQERH